MGGNLRRDGTEQENEGAEKLSQRIMKTEDRLGSGDAGHGSRDWCFIIII